MTPEKCKVTIKGTVHVGTVIESKLDKVKVQPDDKSVRADWFQRNEIKRIWL